MTISVMPTPSENRRIDTSLQPDEFFDRVLKQAGLEAAIPWPPPPWAVRMQKAYKAEIRLLKQRISEIEDAVMQTEKANETPRALARYGESDDVKGLTTRLTYMLPNAGELGQPGVALVAQIAIAHGLDPLPGADHLYAWRQRDKRTGKEAVQVTIGYKGLLHLARKQVRFTYQSRPMTDDERDEHGLQDGAVGYVTALYLIADALECKQAGIPYHPVVGAAVWKPGEEIPRGRTPAWVAKKNSLKDALRQIVTTGMRLQEAIDSALGQVERAEYTGDGWTVAVSREDEHLLIEEGLVPPDDEGEKPMFNGEIIDVEVRPSEGPPEPAPIPAKNPAKPAAPALCTNCGVEPASETPLGSDYCETCASRIADAQAAKSK